MKTLPRAQANILWDELWNNMKSEWFKLEVLQDYSGEDKGESLSAWMAGDKSRSIELALKESGEWAESCRQKVEGGVTLTRIHVVDYPLSPYLLWEIEVYKNRNIPLGKETIYLVDRKDVEDLDLPAGDLMMFDQKNVVIGNYDGTGYAFSQDFYDESDDLTQFLELRRRLLNRKLEKITI